MTREEFEMLTKEQQVEILSKVSLSDLSSLYEQDWEDFLQQELVSITGDDTAKISHYFTTDDKTYVWYSTATHSKTDLVEVLNVV